MENASLKKYLAELIGTFALVFCGTGSIIVDQQSGGTLGLVGISFAFGIFVIAVIYIFGNISGAHINPAVTIALMVAKVTSKIDSLFYILAQISGAFLASLVLKLMFPENLTLGATLPSGELLPSFLMEFTLTFLLMLTIFGATAHKEFSSVAGLIIGLFVTVIILFAGPVSGGSFNPARSLAPAMVSGNLTSVWIYLIAPTLGALTATSVWKVFTSEKQKVVQ